MNRSVPAPAFRRPERLLSVLRGWPAKARRRVLLLSPAKGGRFSAGDSWLALSPFALPFNRRPFNFHPSPLLTERSIINFLIWVGALIAVPYLAVAAVGGNFVPLGVVATIVLLALVFGVLQDRMCLLPLLAGFLQGRLNFIPFRLASSDIAALSLVLYYIIAYMALQRRAIKTGPLVFLIPMLVFIAIVLYHEHDFGLRAFGSGREGAKGALFMELSFIAYLCGVSVNSPSAAFLSRIPLFCISLAILSSIPYVLTTYFPSLSPYLALVTSYINDTALADPDSGEVVRNQATAGIGGYLMVYLMSFYPMHTWLRPARWWIAILGLVCFASVVMGGYRGGLFTFVFSVLTAAVCHYSWRALVVLPPLVFGIFLISAVQDSHIVRLPAAAQRTLDFLPGDWDPGVVSETDSSNDFRDKIKNVYIREELKKSPFFGNGFSYDSDEFSQFNYLARTQETSDGYYGTKIFVTGKMFHIGWISLYDSVGLVGGAAFLLFAGAVIWVTGQGIFRSQVDRHTPFFYLRIWIFCNTFPPLVAYFTVFGDIKLAFPAYCYLAILLTHLNRLEQFGYTPPAVAPPELSFSADRMKTPSFS
jgi:hypothetical protein